MSRMPNDGQGRDLPRIPSRGTFERLFEEYEKRYGALDHSLFGEVGKSARARGYITLEELYQVARWKVGSSRNDRRILKNKGQVEDTTRQAFRSGLKDEERLKILCEKLEGVDIPIASAILTVWRPDRYAIIDEVVWKVFRRWSGGPKSYHSIRAYRAFLGFCREKALALGPPWTPRKIEQAIYALGEDVD